MSQQDNNKPLTVKEIMAPYQPDQPLTNDEYNLIEKLYDNRNECVLPKLTLQSGKYYLKFKQEYSNEVSNYLDNVIGDFYKESDYYSSIIAMHLRMRFDLMFIEEHHPHFLNNFSNLAYFYLLIDVMLLALPL